MAYKIRIGLTGGGTGGHVYPLLAVADALRIPVSVSEPAELHYFGPTGAFGGEFLARNVTTHAISSSKLRRYASIQNIIDIPKFIWSFFQAFVSVYRVMPDALFSKGGPGALPVVFAAWFYRIPILVHESDSIPGLTTRLTAMFAKRIAISFTSASAHFPKAKVAFTGNPVRQDLLSNLPGKAEALSALGFTPDLPLVVVLGGSQGSVRINTFIGESLSLMLEKAQVLHQTGPLNEWNREDALSGVPEIVQSRYVAVPFLDTPGLQQALVAADVVVSRAGAGSIYELAAFGKPAILVPLHGSAGDHQRVNASEYSRTGAATVFEESNLTPNVFSTELSRLLGDAGERAQMSERARAFFKPDAAKILANELVILSQ